MEYLKLKGKLKLCLFQCSESHGDYSNIIFVIKVKYLNITLHFTYSRYSQLHIIKTYINDKTKSFFINNHANLMVFILKLKLFRYTLLSCTDG